VGRAGPLDPRPGPVTQPASRRKDRLSSVQEKPRRHQRRPAPPDLNASVRLTKKGKHQRRPTTRPSPGPPSPPSSRSSVAPARAMRSTCNTGPGLTLRQGPRVVPAGARGPFPTAPKTKATTRPSTTAPGLAAVASHIEGRGPTGSRAGDAVSTAIGYPRPGQPPATAGSTQGHVREVEHWALDARGPSTDPTKRGAPHSLFSWKASHKPTNRRTAADETCRRTPGPVTFGAAERMMEGRPREPRDGHAMNRRGADRRAPRGRGPPGLFRLVPHGVSPSPAHATGRWPPRRFHGEDGEPDYKPGPWGRSVVLVEQRARNRDW